MLRYEELVPHIGELQEGRALAVKDTSPKRANDAYTWVIWISSVRLFVFYSFCILGFAQIIFIRTYRKRRRR